MFKTEFILANVAFFCQGYFAKKKRCCYRSAGACPPRSTDRNENRPQPKGPGRFLLRPKHGEGQALALRCAARFSTFHRSAGACPPRSVHGAGNPLACVCGIRGPTPYGDRKILWNSRIFPKNYKKCSFWEPFPNSGV